MNEYPNALKEKLTSLINEMSASPALFVKNPGKDFTRDRKLPFGTVMHLLISMGGNSIYKELLEAQNYDVNTATASAFIQQRDKILPCAFEFLLHEFTYPFPDTKKYRGYRVLASDGSDLRIATNPNDPDTYLQSHDVNLLHLNALYDLCSKLYVDGYMQSRVSENENTALAKMVDRSRIEGPVIVIADRNYECYNTFAHIENKGWNYVIRVKDLGSSGILSGLDLPSGGEFDIGVRRVLTRKQTKEVKAHPDLYKFISPSSPFDFLDLHINNFYPISFRVVRFKITNDSYETVITNLDCSEWPPEKLKTLYHMRWGIETSFRELKYAVGLANLHSKKVQYIVQEIFARIIMYNFSEMITFHVVISKADTKYLYQVNFTLAIHICKRFLRLLNNVPPLDLDALIQKNILPVRPGRQNNRKIRSQSGVSFLYRVA